MVMGRAGRDSNITKLEQLKFRIKVIELLRFLKAEYTYSQLSRLLGLPPTVLSRYVLGHVVPTYERAKKMWHIIMKAVNIHDRIVERLEFDGSGFFDNTDVINDPFIRKYLAIWIIDRVEGTRVNKILTAAVDGIPLAATLSDELGIPTVIAKKEKEIGVSDFWTIDLIRGSGYRETLYVPKRSLRKKEWVIVVDDVIRTGETQRALIELVTKRIGARLAGVFALISVGDWREKIDLPDGCIADVLITLNENYMKANPGQRGKRGEKRRMGRKRPQGP
ncbi:MAG TPA: adenine phosphoribosyltransferase [Candidatus Bathyarchaeota archaeon]|nr:adenine phosphoribosyltransferase [Candidatus Bathyarchaeota archaeon]